MSVREKQKQHRRERIYQEAVKLFFAKGFAETTIIDIAQAAEVSRGTFFNYYPYKEMILVDYVATSLKDLHCCLEIADPIEALYAIFARLADFVEHNRALIMPLSYELLNPDSERSKVAFQALPLVSMIREALGRGLEQGRIRQDFSIERLSRSLANVYFMTALQWAAYLPDRSIHEEMSKQLTIALEGMAA
ncbi:MAG: TetR/AcrR family transcriptional regulator [Deinococcales bacterium]